jgi:predicted unusual protein kinase regulating ubiquinone biosynthesis (AarF/ABC1/UbiB family)
MKEQITIPTGKVSRALNFVGAGAKVGANYVKYYVKKQVGDEQKARDEMDQSNADDIYQTLSTLKGSALKVAQMLSMDRNILPAAYQDKFQLAQYSAPPLSYPLVKRTFMSELHQDPEKLFDRFNTVASHAASIGQVHQAEKGGKTYAVKIQYPGVAQSVSSDLRMVRPIATRLFNLQGSDINKYFDEVRIKLLEETDYPLEMKRGRMISEACRHLDNTVFPEYYSEWSSQRILTMSWMHGRPLPEFLATNPSVEDRNKIGQALWDFYHYQIYHLKMVHADPHPGNFLVDDSGRLVVLDFGCVKEIPESFFRDYFKLLTPGILEEEEEFHQTLYALDFLLKDDDPQKVPFYTSVFKQMISLLSRPFYTETFDFSDATFFNEIYATGERFTSMKELKEANGARGSQHGLYINRTYFGLYNLLHIIQAKVDTRIPLNVEEQL